MSYETTKTNKLRSPQFFDTYLKGRVIDIGCGPDPVLATAETFDLPDGDAQQIAKFRPSGSYDCVYSSHCLEHMRDVPAALAQWWSLVKPGGYLIIVVPDEDLYEQGVWPSRFNPDHKATFTLHSGPSWSPVSYNAKDVIAALPGAEIVSAELQDDAYDRSLQGHGETGLGRGLLKVYNRFARRAFQKIGWDSTETVKPFVRSARRLGMLVDQSGRGALCQIQVVARKSTANVP